MNNQFKITYDPYAKAITYAYRSKSGGGWQDLAGESDLLNQHSKGALQNHSEAIVQMIIEDFCTDGQDVDLIFRGTRLDWEELKKIVPQIDSKHRIHCLDDSFEEMISPENALVEIEKIFRGLDDQFKASQDLEEVKQYIDQYLEATRPEIVLVAVGTYSAGKSSFINALIGEELLPTASKPTTAKIFKIFSQPEGKWYDTKIQFKYGTQDVELSFNERGYCLDDLSDLPNLELKYCLDNGLNGITPSAAYVYHTISILNRFNELKGNGEENLISELIEVHTPFHRPTLPLKNCQFIIYDLPGPNTPNHKEHREVLKTALEKQTNGVPIFVVDPDSMSSDSVDELRREIAGIEALDESNIIIVVNKADQKDPDTLSENIHSSKGVSVMKDAENRVFCVSSVVGLAAKKDDMTRCISKDILRIYRRLKNEFLSGEMMLFEVDDALPQNRYRDICSAGKKANEQGDSRQKLLHNSGLWAVEDEITRFAEKYAAFNKCKQAQFFLEKAIQAVQQKNHHEEDMQTEALEKAQTQFSESKKALLESLNEKSQQKQSTLFDGYKKRQQELASGAINQAQERWSKETVSKVWRSMKGNSYVPESHMQDWINDQLLIQLKAIQDRLVNQTESYWSKKIAEYKQLCVNVIIGSSELTPEEKKFLEKYIVDCPAPEQVKIAPFDFEKEAKSSYSFLFLKWTSFDKKKCADSMVQAFREALFGLAQDYGNLVRKVIQKWFRSFDAGIIGELSTFSPELKPLAQVIKTHEDKLVHLEKIEKQLADTKRRINELF